MDQYENIAKYNIAETCCASISVEQLQELSENKTGSILDLPRKLTYGAIRGSDALRSNLARLYSAKGGAPLLADDILITPGAIAANHLLFYSLVGPGDHVICHYPTYQQLYSVPKSLGAEVDLWEARPEKNWIPDIEELEGLIKPNTKLIVIKYVPPLSNSTHILTPPPSNPNNPTGQVLRRSLLQSIVDLAAAHDITILSDEVYRPIFHSITPMDADFPPSILSLNYKRTVAVGSLSKAYSLAGIRVGWLASRDPAVIEACAQARHYTTVSVSQLDEQVAAFALAPATIHALLARNIQLARANLDLLERFVGRHEEECEWVRPVAGTTAFVKFRRGGKPVDDVELCKRLIEKTGVMFVPGSQCFGEEWRGYVRIGFVCETEVLKDGLKEVQAYLKKEFDELPLAE